MESPPALRRRDVNKSDLNLDESDDEDVSKSRPRLVAEANMEDAEDTDSALDELEDEEDETSNNVTPRHKGVKSKVAKFLDGLPPRLQY